MLLVSKRVMLRTCHPTHTLLEVVTHAVAIHLAIQESLTDECFLLSRSQPPRRGLPFFSYLHTEVSRLWKKPVSYRVFSPITSNYSNIVGLKQYGYGAMPREEEILSPDSALSLKALKLPTKPVRTTSALVGKAYSAILQAYQANLLMDLDEDEELRNCVGLQLYLSGPPRRTLPGRVLFLGMVWDSSTMQA